ncbi:uncharacterized protein LOC126175108 [Schistocerca cancellata]|uniref:uncharacterized protein LOC126175108 n=1 Tax=Schistocerca cancellata TaxID=274614 RepID=UPI0021174DDB|nr:uncharacterized protein LOC126175108 [Schistocerca cancellata]
MAPLPTLLLVLLFATAGHASSLPRAGCSVDVNRSKMPSPQPLLLKPGGSKDVHGFVTPDSSGVISLSQNQQIIVACPGNIIQVTKQPQATASCVSGSTFSINGKSYNFTDLACKSKPKPSERIPAQSAQSCGSRGQYQVVQLGFQVGSDFYTLIDACFDNRSYSTVYDHFTMVAEIGGKQNDSSRPKKWLRGTFFSNIDMEYYYNRTTQVNTVGRLLGDPKLGSTYISEINSTSARENYFLSKGHLTARTDFSLVAQRYVTFFYMNSAPQWQTFNGGNWETMEDNVRSYAANNGTELEIYTGTHGITTLPSKTNYKTQLFLCIDGGNYIPVPKLFWKIVYKAVTKAAVVFLGVNNPYIKNPGSDYYICKNVCPNITWIKWKPKSQKNGYSYCCEYADFKKSVADAPSLSVTSLLT